MNILILGGLFALGIAAIVVMVVLAAREHHQNSASAKGTTGQRLSPIEPPPNSDPSVPATSPTQKLTKPLDERNTLEGRDEQGVGVQLIPIPLTEFQQFHKLADEIRILHQHAWNLEQQLGRLSDMVDHIEHAQNGHTSVEEEPSLTAHALLAEA